MTYTELNLKLKNNKYIKTKYFKTKGKAVKEKKKWEKSPRHLRSWITEVRKDYAKRRL